MHAGGVEEALSLRKHTATRFFSCLEASAVRLLDIQAVPEALHRRTALLGSLAITSAAQRLPVAVILQMRTKFCRSLLTAFVRVSDKPFHAPLLGYRRTKLGHPQCDHVQAGPHVRIHRQAFDLAGVNRSSMQRTRTRPPFVHRQVMSDSHT